MKNITLIIFVVSVITPHVFLGMDINLKEQNGYQEDNDQQPITEPPTARAESNESKINFYKSEFDKIKENTDKIEKAIKSIRQIDELSTDEYRTYHAELNAVENDKNFHYINFGLKFHLKKFHETLDDSFSLAKNKSEELLEQYNNLIKRILDIKEDLEEKSELTQVKKFCFALEKKQRNLKSGAVTWSKISFDSDEINKMLTRINDLKLKFNNPNKKYKTDHNFINQLVKQCDELYKRISNALDYLEENKPLDALY